MVYDNQLYLHDSYQKEFDAKVISIKDNKFVVLDKTAFYPNAGGQPHDEGKILSKDGKKYDVVYVAKINSRISHEIKVNENNSLKEGDDVHCVIDWDRRYKFMRSHTAAHVVSGVIAKELGAQITGNQKTLEKVRIDFNTDIFDKNYLKELVEKSNDIIRKKLDVNTYFITMDELKSRQDLMKLAKGLPCDVNEVRIVDIDGFDKQPCGGTHVRNLKEIGKLEFICAENKGKNNRRLYFRLSD